ncbi:hypothetical protein A7985_14310 [Pseudoalteromonas luteoviolacea]|uniref:Uncharacterized protein n=1 Tax=Pseudoalteromonas luteoviolacea TaxID=43657 RepID=A0A1C0TPT8_9GAMM|nr:hypothetical protein A7985_14310 [Pseudoalteromonas luteoviolacea]
MRKLQYLLLGSAVFGFYLLIRKKEKSIEGVILVSKNALVVLARFYIFEGTEVGGFILPSQKVRLKQTGSKLLLL